MNILKIGVIMENEHTAIIMVIEDVKPLGKGRYRFVKRTGHTYTPEATYNYENIIKLNFMKKHPKFKPFDVPLRADFIFQFKPNKNTSKKNIEFIGLNTIPYCKKPDFDNLTKIICDALNEVAYTDDRLICESTIKKQYGDKNKIIVKFTPIFLEEEVKEVYNKLHK